MKTSRYSFFFFYSRYIPSERSLPEEKGQTRAMVYRNASFLPLVDDGGINTKRLVTRHHRTGGGSSGDWCRLVGARKDVVKVVTRELVGGLGILADRSAERIREPMLGVYSNRSRGGEPRLPHEAEHEQVDKIGRRGRTPTMAP